MSVTQEELLQLEMRLREDSQKVISTLAEVGREIGEVAVEMKYAREQSQKTTQTVTKLVDEVSGLKTTVALLESDRQDTKDNKKMLQKLLYSLLGTAVISAVGLLYTLAITVQT